MIQLELRNLTIGYGSATIIDNLSLAIHDGEIVSLLGPSGAGKTTILKTIAGLLQPTEGQILISNSPVNHLPAEKRDAVLIFQKPLLFPFLNVAQNIGFGLKMQKMDQRQAEKKIAEIVEITDLEGLHNRKVHQLSGGQQQRVALARALVLEPAILLLDEPLSNLDAELRLQMRELIRTVQKRTGTTMLFVTHDQSEALAISDRVCLLLDGALRQTGSPEELFYFPADPEVARFFGCDNIFSSKDSSCHHFFNSRDMGKTFTIRPEDIKLYPAGQEPPATSTFALKGTVTEVTFEGRLTRVIVDVGGDTRVAVLCRRPMFHIGQNVRLQIPENRIHFFP